MIKTTTAVSAYENTIQTFVKKQTGRHATNAQEDTIFTMRHLFQLIPLGILKLQHMYKLPKSWVIGQKDKRVPSTFNK